MGAGILIFNLFLLFLEFQFKLGFSVKRTGNQSPNHDFFFKCTCFSFGIENIDSIYSVDPDEGQELEQDRLFVIKKYDFQSNYRKVKLLPVKAFQELVKGEIIKKEPDDHFFPLYIKGREYFFNTL